MTLPTLRNLGHRLRLLGRLVSDALSDHGIDLQQAPLGHALLLLAIPMVLEMVMESVFAVVDILFVARLGADAVAAVGITESLLALVYTAAMGLGIGVTALVARRIGEGRPEAASVVAVQATALGLLVAAVIAAIGVTWTAPLLRLMGADEAVVATGLGYARVSLGSNAVILLLFMLNAVFRGAGDAALAMRVLWVANGANLLLDPLLIFGWGPVPAMGVTGAAWASAIGRGLGVAMQCWALWRGPGRVRVHWPDVRLAPSVMLAVVRLSGWGTVQVFIGTASWIGLVRVLATFGSAAVAGYTIGIRVIIFLLMPAFGLANAAATMVGQGLGAGRPDRAERAAWLATAYNGAFLGVLGLVLAIWAPVFAAPFTGEPEVLAIATECLRVIGVGSFFYATGMVLTQAFNGAGDTWTPTWLNLICFWLWELPLAWVLAVPLGFGPTGVFTAVAVAYSTLAVLSAVLFRRGRWKLRTV